LSVEYGREVCDQNSSSIYILSDRNRRTGTIFDLPRFSGSPPGNVTRANRPFPVFRPTVPVGENCIFFLGSEKIPDLRTAFGKLPYFLTRPMLVRSARVREPDEDRDVASRNGY
jgi:hypothetical protein